jgi:hypothetical protein
MKSSVVTKSNSGPDYGAEITATARKAHEDVTASARSKSAEIGTLQTFAREFLRWDKSASKQARKALERFASMPRSDENCTAINAYAFRDAFWSTIDSSAEEDSTRPENASDDPYSEDKEIAWRRNQQVRQAFRKAVSNGASQHDTDEMLEAIKDAKKGK